MRKMIPKSFSSTTIFLRKNFLCSFTPLIFHTKNSHAKLIRNSSNYPFRPATRSIFGFKRNNYEKQTRVPPLLASRGSNHEENKAMEMVLRLYKAIKNKDLNEVSEIIGHDCLCVCSFVSMFKSFSGKKQVMEFFSYLMANLGNTFEFVVQPTLHDGMMVGVSWKLECSKTHKPIGKGFSFHMCHIYQGKVLISNVEMFLEPLLHIEPSALKMVGLVAGIIGQMVSQGILKGEKKKAGYVLCCLVTLAIFFIILRLYLW